MVMRGSALPDWLRIWRRSAPTEAFDGVASTDVGGEDIAELVCHDEREARGGEELDQVAVARLGDGRWAAFSFFMFSRTRPYMRGVAVAGSLQRVWWFGLDDDDRERLAPQLDATHAALVGERFIVEPDEERFLAALRAMPDDAATRAVYADFLEEHGDLARAQLARMRDAPRHRRFAPDELANVWPRPDVPMPAVEAKWRALVVDAPIVRCHAEERYNRPPGYHARPVIGTECDLRWRSASPSTIPGTNVSTASAASTTAAVTSALARTAATAATAAAVATASAASTTSSDLVRRCPSRGVWAGGTAIGCGAVVHYCTSYEACRAAGRARASIVLDPALDVAAALGAYDSEAWSFELPPPPVPPPSPPASGPTKPDDHQRPRGLWSRVRRWFR